MKSLIGLLITMCILVVSCSTYHQSVLQPNLETTNFHLEIEKIADQEITGEAYSGYLFGFINVAGESKFADGITYPESNGEYSELKSAAAYDAIKKAGCDILIAPRYIVETSNSLFYRSVTVRVFGYPGKYTALHSNN